MQSRLQMSRDTAYSMISVFETLGESVGRVRHFDDLPARVLYALAAPSTPEEVRAEVERLLVDGQKVTAADVRRMRDEALAATVSAGGGHRSAIIG